MDRYTTLLILIGLFSWHGGYFCDGYYLYPSDYGGGGKSGDPAPGRSPGPPSDTKENGKPEQSAPNDQTDAVKSACEVSGTPAAMEEHVLSLNVSHHLFGTEALVEGMDYEGRIFDYFSVILRYLYKKIATFSHHISEKKLIFVNKFSFLDRSYL